jgi:hypothetical protein
MRPGFATRTQVAEANRNSHADQRRESGLRDPGVDVRRRTSGLIQRCATPPGLIDQSHGAGLLVRTYVRNARLRVCACVRVCVCGACVCSKPSSWRTHPSVRASVVPVIRS